MHASRRNIASAKLQNHEAQCKYYVDRLVDIYVKKSVRNSGLGLELTYSSFGLFTLCRFVSLNYSSHECLRFSGYLFSH